MNIKINPSRLSGEIKAPPSKSASHRALICAALSEGVSHLYGISPCVDTQQTIGCLENIGVKITKNGDDYTVFGIDPRKAIPQGNFYCKESGSTLRFMIPIASLTGRECYFTGEDSLLRRPMSIFSDIFCKDNAFFNIEPYGISVKGPLPSGEIKVPGNVSSQFITGLLLALPFGKEDSTIIIEPPFESSSYVRITLEIMKKFGADVKFISDFEIQVKRGSYRTTDMEIESDYSSAAFIDALSYLGHSVKVSGLSSNSKQGDRIYQEYFPLLKSGTPVLDISDCPDLGPILFALAAALNGGTFIGTERLRIKESDRIKAMTDELAKLSVKCEIGENSVTIHPGIIAPSEAIIGHNDHRIVMAMATLLTLVGGEIIGAEAISKSFPSYFDNLRALGGEIKNDT